MTTIRGAHGPQGAGPRPAGRRAGLPYPARPERRAYLPDDDRRPDRPADLLRRRQRHVDRVSVRHGHAAVRRDATQPVRPALRQRPARCTPTAAGAWARAAASSPGGRCCGAYAFIAIAGFAGFSIFLNQFLAGLGIHHQLPGVLCFAISAAICWFVAFKDIRVSSLLMLLLEGLSVAVIVALSVVVLFKHGVSVDTSQLTLKGMGLNDLNLAVVVCIFSLVGFESATALGGEAANPLRNVPRAVTWSLVITGLFFVFISYVEVLGTRSYSSPLSALAAPLNTLADINHVGFLKVPIALGAMFSFFSLSLSCINAGARILYPMAAHGVFPHRLGDTHDRNRTPHVALTASTPSSLFAIISIMQAFTNPLTTFGDAGTLAAFGFLLAYFLVTIASLAYLSASENSGRRTSWSSCWRSPACSSRPSAASTRCRPRLCGSSRTTSSATSWSGRSGCSR